MNWCLVRGVTGMNFSKFFLLYGCLMGLALSCSDLPIYKKSIKADSSPVVSFNPTHSNQSTAFRDVTDELGLSGVEATSFYAVDFDGDSFTDLVVLSEYYSKPEFYRYDPVRSRYELLRDTPFEREQWASYLVFFDYNRDGILDVILGAPKRETALEQYPIRLFVGKNQGMKLSYFELKGVFPPIHEPTYSIAPIDFDLDGKLDLYLANWYSKNRGKMVVTPDRILHQQASQFVDGSDKLKGEFDYLDELELYPNARPTYAAAVCDVDLDGYPDVMTSSSNGMANKLWINQSTEKNHRHFQDFAETSGVAHDKEGMLDRMGGGDSYFSRCVDYNNEGIVDIIAGELSHSYDSSTRDRSAVLTGSSFKFPPRFIRTEYFMDNGTQHWNQGDKRATFLDYNLDGLVDMAIDNNGFPPQSRLIFFHQEENHAFQDRALNYGLDLANPSGTVTLDFNRDGLPDLLVGQVSTRSHQLKRRIFLFKNTTAEQGNHSLQLFLSGVGANSMGWGASIKVVSTNQSQWRYHYPFNGGFSSQDEDGIIFGIAKADRLKRIEVTWPILDGKGKPLKKLYSMQSTKLKKINQFTLCESGAILIGKKKCQP